MDLVEQVNLPRIAKEKSKIFDATPPHFQLEKEKELPPEREFSFVFKAILSLADSIKAKDYFKKVPDAKIHEDMQELELWLANERKNVSQEIDPRQFKELNRLIKDVEIYKNRPIKDAYVLKGTIQDVKSKLTSPIESEKQEMSDLEVQMIELANRKPEDNTQQLLHELREWGGLQKKVSLDDILFSFAQKKPKILQSINPNLTQEDLTQLYTYASQYLLLATQAKQRERCLGLCKKIETLSSDASASEREELEKQLASMLLDIRAFDPAQHPAYLVFEYYADILLRKEQVEKLELFLAGEAVNPVMEMIMGSGKSKVLLPLLGLLRADGQHLSMLIVPSPLFESIASDTQSILLEAFSKHLCTLHFDRNTNFDLRTLEEIRDNLQNVIENEGCLIMTSKSVQSFVLKFIEYADKIYGNGDFETDEWVVMQEIIGLLSTCGYPLIDEADTVLNVLHEVSFSLGAKHSPKKSEQQLIAELYDLLYLDPGLKAIAKLESDWSPNPHAPPLTKEIYHQSLKRPLAEALLERLKIVSLHEAQLDDELREFLARLNHHEKVLLILYLCRDKDHVQETQEFFNTLPTPLKNIFALAGEEISHLLPHTLIKNSDENYGLDQDVFAIPYAAANTPSRGSVFANPYITMNYTYQIHYKKGIDKKVLSLMMQKLQREAMQEIADSNDEKTIIETEAWETFSWIKGEIAMPLFKYNDEQLNVLLNHLNQNPETRKRIISEAFFPCIEIFEQKLSCNPLRLASLFSKISGFTGTLWNADSMHRKLTALPEEGIDAKTISLLWKMSKKENSIHIIPKGSFESMIDKIYEDVQDVDLISDAGAYFKVRGNLKIAQDLAKKWGKPVVFYNLQGEQTITDGVKEMPLSQSSVAEHQRMTFLDQSHTTGADVKQHSHAVGLVTIGRNMLLRDLEQSAWRLRGLDKAQRVVFIIDEEVESIMRQTLGLNALQVIDFPEILKFVLINQCKEQGDHKFKSFKQEIQMELLVDILMNKNLSAEERGAAFQTLRKTWFKPSNLDAAELYGAPAMERPSALVIEEEGNKAKEFLREIANHLPFIADKIESYLKDIDLLMEKSLEGVHPQVISPIADDAETVEIEQETQAEIEIEIETQVHHQEEEIKLGVVKGEFIHVDDLQPEMLDKSYDKIPIFPLEKQFEREPQLREYAPFFKDINITMNVLTWREGEKTLEHLQLLGPQRTPFHHLNVEGNRVTLYTLEDGIYLFLNNNYNLHLGFTRKNEELSESAFQKTVKLKFLNGESYYTKSEVEFLEQWIGEAGCDKMRNLFVRYILNNQPDKAVAFVGSALQKVFNKLLMEEKN